MRVQLSVYVARGAKQHPPDEETTMSAINSWALSILGVIGLVLVLHQLGVDATADLGTMLRGTEHLLSQPLVSL